MYIIPGYIQCKSTGNTLLLESGLLRNIIKLNESKYIEEYHTIEKNGCDKIDSELKKFLVEQGMLVDEKDIIHELERFYNYMDNILMLTVLPTEACNFRCPYCYESHENLQMDENMLEQIKFFILSQKDRVKQIYINWFGGEPTLCKESILSVNQFVQQMLINTDLLFSSNMTTNGYLLDIDSFQKYYKSGVKEYQITLDGFSHDEMRILADGSGTLEQIMTNLSQISKLPQEEYEFKIILRNNVLNDTQDVTWYDYIKEKFGEDSRFYVCVKQVGDFGGERIKNIDIMSPQQAKETMQHHLDYIHSIGMNEINTTMHQGDISMVCYAAYPRGFVFRANGDIVKCTLELENPLNKVGYIDRQKGVIIDKKKNDLWSRNEPDTDCFRCNSLLACMNQACPKCRIIEKNKKCRRGV